MIGALLNRWLGGVRGTYDREAGCWGLGKLAVWGLALPGEHVPPPWPKPLCSRPFLPSPPLPCSLALQSYCGIVPCALPAPAPSPNITTTPPHYTPPIRPPPRTHTPRPPTCVPDGVVKQPQLGDVQLVALPRIPPRNQLQLQPKGGGGRGGEGGRGGDTCRRDSA